MPPETFVERMSGEKGTSQETQLRESYDNGIEREEGRESV